jgi:helix-turn-helix protein
MTPLTRKQVRAAILTAQEAADRLGCVRQTLYKWCDAGLVEPILDTGNSLIFFAADIERLKTSPAFLARRGPGRPIGSKRRRRRR